jgi:hypothetical protein
MRAKHMWTRVRVCRRMIPNPRPWMESNTPSHSFVWCIFLFVVSRFSKRHSWFLPVFACGLGAPRFMWTRVRVCRRMIPNPRPWMESNTPSHSHRLRETIVFFGFVWCIFLFVVSRFSKRHSWFLPVFACGLGGMLVLVGMQKLEWENWTYSSSSDRMVH